MCLWHARRFRKPIRAVVRGGNSNEFVSGGRARALHSCFRIAPQSLETVSPNRKARRGSHSPGIEGSFHGREPLQSLACSRAIYSLISAF